LHTHSFGGRGRVVAIEELVAFIPPPAHPINGAGDWSAAERELGFAFPDDFKQLIRVYGSGEFYGSLYVVNPLTGDGRDWIRRKLDRCRELREVIEQYVRPLPPDSPGLLPWGGDSNGHMYCWLVDESEEGWEVVQLFHGYEGEIDPVPGPVTSFLVRFMRNEYPNMLGGNRFTVQDRIFTPVP
jgi:hypothetical protein